MLAGVQEWLQIVKWCLHLYIYKSLFLCIFKYIPLNHLEQPKISG